MSFVFICVTHWHVGLHKILFPMRIIRLIYLYSLKNNYHLNLGVISTKAKTSSNVAIKEINTNQSINQSCIFKINLKKNETKMEPNNFAWIYFKRGSTMFSQF